MLNILTLASQHIDFRCMHKLIVFRYYLIFINVARLHVVCLFVCLQNMDTRTHSHAYIHRYFTGFVRKIHDKDLKLLPNHNDRYICNASYKHISLSLSLCLCVQVSSTRISHLDSHSFYPCTFLVLQSLNLM